MREFLSRRGVTFTERDFFRDPFSREELEHLLAGQSPAVMFNPKSSALKNRGLNIDALPENQLIDLMLQEPRFIRRPIVTINGRTYFGVSESTLAPLLS